MIAKRLTEPLGLTQLSQTTDDQTSDSDKNGTNVNQIKQDVLDVNSLEDAKVSDLAGSLLQMPAGKLGMLKIMDLSAEVPTTDASFVYTYHDDGTATLDGVASVVNSTTLTIPGTTVNEENKQTYAVTAIASGAFASSTGRTANVSTVVIGDGIKSIGTNAFAYLKNLQVVDLSENHTLETIGDRAFVSTGVTSLTLPETVTSIGDSAFTYDNLTTLDLSQATNLKTIGDEAFLGSKIDSLVLPDSVTTIGDEAFKFNSNLTNVKLSKSLTKIGDSAFAGAKITSLNLNGATIGAGAFEDNQDLTTVTLGSDVTEIGESAFNGDKNLTTLNIPSDSQLTTIDASAFYGTGLTAVHFPATLTSIGTAAFESNTDLADVTFAGQAANDDLTIGEDAFAYDGHIVNLSLPANLVTISKEAFAADNLKDATGNTIGGLKTVTFADGSRLTTVGDSAFVYDTVLEDITLPDSVTTIGTQAFLANSALKSFTLPASLQSIGNNAFTYDDGLKTVDTSKANQLEKIGDGAFEYSGITDSGQTDADGNPIFVMPTNTQTIGNYAFAGSHIKTVSFNDGLQTIGNNAFSYNELDGSLNLPNSVTTVGAKAFYGNQIKGVTVPSAANVGEAAFDYNRITQLSTSADNGAVALNQFAAYFGNSKNVTIDTLFDTQVGDLTNKNLVIDATSLTNGVTYNQADGTFSIPEGTAGFKFNWSLPGADGTNLYGGAYQVVLNDPVIKVVDGQAWYKDNWTPADNFISAKTLNGDVIDFSALTVTAAKVTGGSVTEPVTESVPVNQVTQTAGTYLITYSYNGEDAQTITLTVSKRQGTYTLTGNQTVQYTGTTPKLVAADGNYQVTMSDGFVYTVKDDDLEIVPTETDTRTATSNLPNVGTYRVQLKESAIDRAMSEAPSADLFEWTDKNSTATLTITPAKITVSVKGDQTDGVTQLTKVAGTDDPTPTFVVTADDDETQTPLTNFPLTIGYTREQGETVGVYKYMPSVQGTDAVSASNFDVTYLPATLKIAAAPVTVSGKKYTMTVGDATPTAADFGATGTDENAQAVTADKIVLDLSNANLTKAGDYQVTLSYGKQPNEQTISVPLHVNAAATGGDTGNSGNQTDPDTGNGGGATTEPTTPTKPVKPTTPVKPTKPAKPTKPVTPTTPVMPAKPTPGQSGDQYIVSESGTHENVSAGTSGEHDVQQFLVKSGGAAAMVQMADDAPTASHQTAATRLAKATMATAPATTKRNQGTPATSTTDQPAATKLPQTGDAQTPWWALLGTLLGGLSLVGWQRKRHD
ncbi:leucine-rich repeat protein [Levilactobacillus mulengensis]|uniref:leucine-rich repeat protein n=1 Tax=Levilactobacillus mulengensis TaxID=2486025 RepID=UPI000F7B0239|nr:leucine-rich repeat protein [Levilactobacillus mulengensis]